MNTRYPNTCYDTTELEDALTGHRIVEAEENPGSPGETTGLWSWHDPEIVLTLDNGTKIYLSGNEGGCICGAGDYRLAKHVSTTDNIITAVHVEAAPGSDDDDDDGHYSIFVYTGNAKIEAVRFDGTDGNGYYGTGFEFLVDKVELA